MTLSDAQIRNYDAQGLIPGPQESEEEFVARAEYCLQLDEHLADVLPFPNIAASQPLEEALPLVEQQYGMTPRWLPLYFSNYRLLPWHGAAAWIVQLREETPTAAFLQLRRPFAKKKRLYHLYHRDEVIAHESAHVGRMAFEEPKFEELLACGTFRSRWHRDVAALIQSGKESAFFAFLLMLLFIVDLFVLIFEPSAFTTMQLLKVLPATLIAAACWRLYRRRRQLAACVENLVALTDHPNAFAYRLTDNEIATFAAATPEAITAYAAEEKSIRWRLLKLHLQQQPEGKQ